MSFDKFVSVDHLPINDTSIVMGDGAASAAYAVSIVNSDVAPVRKGVRMNNGGYVELSTPSLSEVRWGCVYATGNNSQGDTFGALMSPAGALLTFGRVVGGGVTVYRGGTLLGTTNQNFPYGAWNYFEFHVKLDTNGTDGEVHINFNGVEVLALTGVDTTNVTGPISGVRVYGTWGFGWANDMYVTDRAAFWGPITANYFYPTSDVTKQWTPSTGTDHYALLDETSSSGTDYVETTAVDQTDLFEIPNLAPGSNSIIAVVTGTVGIAPAGGAPLVSHLMEVDGVTATPAGRQLRGVYSTQLTPHMTQPNGSAWNLAAFNAARIGIKSVA